MTKIKGSLNLRFSGETQATERQFSIFDFNKMTKFNKFKINHNIYAQV